MTWLKTDGKVVVPGFIMMLIMGSVYSYSVFRLSIESIYLVSKSMSGLPYMLSLFFYAVFMGVSGRLLHTYSAFRIMIIGVLFIALGWLLPFIIKNFFVLTLGYGFFIGAGIGFIYGVPLMIIGHLFPNKKGLYFGIVLFGFGLSPLLSAPILQSLVSKYDLHQTFLFMSIFTLVSLFILSLFYRTYDIHTQNNDLPPFKKTFSKPQFKILYLTFFIGTFIGLTVIGFSSTYAVEVLDFSLEKAALFVSLFALFNGLGRVFFGYLTDKIPLYLIMVISYLSLLLSTGMVLIFSTSIFIFALSFSLIWMNLGGWLAIAPAATSKLFGAQAYTRNYGMLFSAYGLSAILGVLISGILTDALGTYDTSFYIFLSLSLIGMVLTFYIKKLTFSNQAKG